MPGRRGGTRWVRSLGLAALVGLACGAARDPAGPTQPPVPTRPALRVLFVGNSLTYTNDLPGLVAGIATAAGEERRLAWRTVAYPGVSLSDHWATGDALDALADPAGWNVVVLQQGPSSLPESRDHLVEWSGRFAERIRAAGARPALFMVWPEASRMEAFDAVRESYAAAAAAAEGILLPAGEGWRAAWRRDPELALYGPDGLHPTRLGSLLAALIVYEGLYGRSPVGLPAELPHPGADPVRFSPEVARLVQEAAAEAYARWGGAVVPARP